MMTKVLVISDNGRDLEYAMNAVMDVGHEPVQIWARPFDLVIALNDFFRKSDHDGIKLVIYANASEGWRTAARYFHGSKVPFGVICPDEERAEIVKKQGFLAFNKKSEKRDRALENFLRDASQSEDYDFAIDTTDRDCY